MIGRLGRSLHIHLLLASQRLEEGKLRGLDSHLSYRIGLKTFSAGESRSVLGVPDAYHLPSVPGSAFLKCDADQNPFGSTPVLRLRRVRQASRVGADRPHVPAGRAGAQAVHRYTGREGPGTGRASQLKRRTRIEPARHRRGPTKTTLLDVVVSRLRGHGRPAHEVWLPPLDDSPAVNDAAARCDMGAIRATSTGGLWMPIGVVDRPYDQRRDVLMVDLSGAQGNIAVVGGPQSGKSTALRTLIMAAAATHTPEQLQFYCLDFGGGTLTSLTKLPHVGSVAGRMDADRIRRTVAEVAGSAA